MRHSLELRFQHLVRLSPILTLVLLLLLLIMFLVCIQPFGYDRHPVPSLPVPAQAGTLSDPLELINPLIGTTKGGHVFPGATLPFGMAKSVADTDGETWGGYDSRGTVIRGFSHMHDSGSGSGPSMGNFPIFPYSSCPDNDPTQCEFDRLSRAVGWNHRNVTAKPGLFAVHLDNGIYAEMTTLNRSALYRFTFPSGQTTSPNASDTLDYGARSGDSLPLHAHGHALAGQMPVILVEADDIASTVEDPHVGVYPETGHIMASGLFRPSFGEGRFTVYFCADFPGATVHRMGTTGKYAYAQFNPPPDNQILVRVGISFIRVEQACQNAGTELAKSDFGSTVFIAQAAWRKKLDFVHLKPGGVEKKMEVIFWSGFYRSMINPQNYTGENPLWTSNEQYYDSFYCLWDTFRTSYPFLILVDPESLSLFVRALVDIYRHLGWLPDCRMSLCKGATQGGSNADVVIAESYIKRIPGIDWDAAYEAIVTDAEKQPFNWLLGGRGGLDSWKKLGYVAKDDCTGASLCTRSVSRTVEYAFNDYCIAEVAKARGNTASYNKYLARSGNWQNLFHANQTSIVDGKTFTGFLQPRTMDRQWVYEDPILCSPRKFRYKCYLVQGGYEVYEGSSWLYTFYVPHDMAKLITTLGGAKEFVDRLNFLHSAGLLDIGNEQAFLTIYQFHYAGRPGLSSKWAHSYIPSRFHDGVNGIPGNDDSGAMGSFVVLAMMGLYPVHGLDVYLITAPFFEEVSIKNRLTGKTAIIRNKNFDPNYKRIYIQGVTRDGKPWIKNWIQHDFFTGGGLLELTLGEEESAWGTDSKDLPPSVSTERK